MSMKVAAMGFNDYRGPKCDPAKLAPRMTPTNATTHPRRALRCARNARRARAAVGPPREAFWRWTKPRSHRREGRDGLLQGALSRGQGRGFTRRLFAPAAPTSSPGSSTARSRSQTMMDAIRVPRLRRRAARPRRDSARRGLRLVCVSNWDISLPEVLERCGLGDAFDGVVTSAEAASESLTRRSSWPR